MIKIAIIGYGYWGPNLLRNFSNQTDCKVVAVIDSNPERLEKVRKVDRLIKCYTSIDNFEIVNNIDAVVIATNVTTHYDLAKHFLLLGKHVLVEKPLTNSVAKAKELIELAFNKNLILMVDHTFLYTPAVRKIKDLIQNDDIGSIKFYDSTRINLGLFQPDINVLWDLAPHDLSILLYLTEQMPLSVCASGISHTKNAIENIAYMTLEYEDGLIAHLNCSWSSPVKIRSTIIGGSEKMIVYNDLEPSDKIKIYETTYDHRNLDNGILVDYRVGDIYLPKLDSYEALGLMAKDFIKSIFNSSIPTSSSSLGLKVVEILEASDLSLKNENKKINLI